VSEAKGSGYVEGLFDRAKAVRLEDLLERLGIALEVHGEELRGICPIPAHKGEKKTRSFYVKPSEQVFHCFGCKAGGNIVKFTQAYRGLAPYESKTAALWIVETMAESDATEEPIADQALEAIVAEESSHEDEALLQALTLAGEAIIRAIAHHADNPRPLAERLARWIVEMVKVQLR
jgi:CHC2-type zinc finger protein